MERRVQVSIIIVINILILILGSIYIELPGVYFDSAIADFLASTIVHPEIDNQTGMTMSHVGIPVVGSIYHGVLSMFAQIIVLSFAHGTAFTLRVVYLLYVVICADLVYVIVRRVTNNIYISISGMLLCGTCISVITVTRTQYDIMLPGTCFFMLSFITLYRIITSEKDDFLALSRSFYLLSLCLGISFYDYFCFLFFVPVIVFLALKYNGQHFVYVLVSAIWGFLCGCNLYFCGFTDSLITNVMGNTRITVLSLILFVMVFYTVLGIPSVYILRGKKVPSIIVKVYIVTLIVIAIAALIIGFIFLRLIISKFSDFGFDGVKARINDNGPSVAIKFFYLFYSLVSGQAAELQINGVSTSLFACLYFVIWGIGTALFIIISIIKKKLSKIGEFIFWLMTFYLSFYICSIPLISGMQEQHLVPLLFMTFPYIILIIWYVFEEIKVKEPKIIILLSLCLVLLNIFDISAFYKKLVVTRGIGAYSEKLNELFEDAYNKSFEEKDVYFLVNPGIFPSFVYMTDNHIKVELLYGVNGNYDPDKASLINEYLSDGYKVFLLSVYYDLDETIDELGSSYNITFKEKINSKDTNGSLVYSLCEIE